METVIQSNTDEIARQLQELPEPYAVIGVGIPGAGKSTTLRAMAAELDLVRVCPDEIREELTGDPADQSANARVWELTYQRANDALQGDRSIVIDATHTGLSFREQSHKKCRSFGAAAVAAVVLTYHYGWRSSAMSRATVLYQSMCFTACTLHCEKNLSPPAKASTPSSGSRLVLKPSR